MSTVSCAPPDRRTPFATRAARLTRLLAHLLRMWAGARLLAPRLRPAARAHLMRRWARRLLRGLAVEVRLHGAPVPEAALLVANHVSWLDTYAIHTVEAARFVAKAEVGTWPVIGTIAARFGTIFIRRRCVRSAARVVGALAEALCRGESVAAFPEATTSDGRDLLPFFPAMFQAAVLTGARVQPVALRYRDVAGGHSTAAPYVGAMSILDSLRLLVREPRMTVDVIFCPPIDPHGLGRRELAARSRAAIADALGLAAATDPTPLRRAA
ncbi:1-acyl-sn-glycerol-3-phosphate acyltransferase [bacterium]|nr:1-acyl-sn-glycerol-3-phosphate acyltransferase [bacterium]